MRKRIISFVGAGFIAAAPLGAGATSDAGGPGNPGDESSDECSFWIYKSEESRFGFGDHGRVCWELPRGALTIEDTSWKKPLGGPNSFPNEVKAKLHDKPKRWINKRLGTKW